MANCIIQTVKENSVSYTDKGRVPLVAPHPYTIELCAVISCIGLYYNEIHQSFSTWTWDKLIAKIHSSSTG